MWWKYIHIRVLGGLCGPGLILLLELSIQSLNTKYLFGVEVIDYCLYLGGMVIISVKSTALGIGFAI